MSAAAKHAPAQTILLVDDEPSIRRVAEKYLTNHGYHVLSASSGEEALRQAQAHDGSIDLVVTDVVMPTMDGPMLVARLVDERPALQRVVYISGFSDAAPPAGQPPQVLSLYVPKPFELPELLRAVQALLA